MDPAQLVRLCLQHHRTLGASFDVAWTRALQSLPRGDIGGMRSDRAVWVAVLRWARPEFEAAYYLRERTVPLTDPALQEPDEADTLAIAS